MEEKLKKKEEALEDMINKRDLESRRLCEVEVQNNERKREIQVSGQLGTRQVDIEVSLDKKII